MQYTEKFIEIDAPLERVFDLFSNFENFPRWMRNIKDVHYSGRHFTRWTAAAPLGSEVEWEAETTIYQPDHKIAWRSVRGDVDTEGEVIFEETRRGTTRMHVLLGYRPPAGRLGAMIASLFGANPEQQLEDDLERFAAVAEGRRTAGPYRDARERREEYDYAPRSSGSAPRGRSSAQNFAYDDRDARPAPRRRTHADVRDEDEAARNYRFEPERQEHGRERSRSFDDQLRAARLSQLESRRRHMEERGREEERRRYMERDEQLRRDAVRERSREEFREREAPARYEDARGREQRTHSDERTHGYAMTPRERARERRQGREPDYGYTEKAFSRGVDKLMDDAPSNRWRR